MQKLLFTIMLLLQVAGSEAQQVTRLEYFINTDMGVGKNTLVDLTPAADNIFAFTVNLTGITPGKYFLYIRTMDNNGNWSITTRKRIEVVTNVVKQIVIGEYFIDTDPGYNSAIPISVALQDSAILQNFSANLSSLNEGYHKLYVRMLDSHGHWSLPTRRTIEVLNTPAAIGGGEYFFNTDPGIGSATPILFTDTTGGDFKFKIRAEDIPVGAHTLYVRARDSTSNNWSHTNWKSDTVITSVATGLWSDINTWSNKKIPDTNTVVILHHNVIVDIMAYCRSLTSFKNTVVVSVNPGQKLNIIGY